MTNNNELEESTEPVTSINVAIGSGKNVSINAHVSFTIVDEAPSVNMAKIITDTVLKTFADREEVSLPAGSYALSLTVSAYQVSESADPDKAEAK